MGNLPKHQKSTTTVLHSTSQQHGNDEKALHPSAFNNRHLDLGHLDWDHSAGQKCHNGGKKCVATKADGAKFTKNECISHWGSLWCADKEKWTSSSGWDWGCKDC